MDIYETNGEIPEAQDTGEGWLDDEAEWLDVDQSKLTDESDDGDGEAAEAGAEADQRKPGTDGDAGEDGGDGGPQEKDEGADQTFELKHLDETRTVSREEVIALAQKGLDYDRVRAKLDELRAGEGREAQNQPFRDFVQELAESAGCSPEELMDQTRARMIAAKDGISELDALNRAKTARAEKAANEQRRAEEAREQAAQREVRRFVELYPGVKSEDIPAKVWEEAERTGDLVGSWQRHENAQLRARIESLEKEKENLALDKKNEERSTGSRKSAGASSRSREDEAWEEALKSGLW